MTTTGKIEKVIEKMVEGTTFKYQQLNIPNDEYIAAAKAIERLITKEIIKRISTGIFYKPKKSVFGDLLPREEELLKPYLFVGNRRIAYITGASLYNKFGLSSQVPKTIKVASREKRISTQIGNMEVKPVKSYIDVTDDNFFLLELLDILKDIKVIPDVDKTMAIKFMGNKIKELSDKDRAILIKYAMKYPPRVRALLGSLLNNIGIKNETDGLKKSLNPFSEYILRINNEVLSTATIWNIK